MMRALAAEAAGQAEPFYQDAEFWVLVAFVILMAFAARPVFRRIAAALDQRAATIRRQIDEAARLREEAQELLASFQRRQRDAAKDAADIVAQAREQAAGLAATAAADLERTLARREQLARERIAQAEAKAIAEVREVAIDVAVEAARRVLTESLAGDRGEALLDATIKDLPEKLH